MAWRSLQKLVKNGNSTQVTVPKSLLYYLGWLPGGYIVLETTEDKKLVVRLATGEDVAPPRMRPMVTQVFEEMKP